MLSPNFRRGTSALRTSLRRCREPPAPPQTDSPQVALSPESIPLSPVQKHTAHWNPLAHPSPPGSTGYSPRISFARSEPRPNSDEDKPSAAASPPPPSTAASPSAVLSPPSAISPWKNKWCPGYSKPPPPPHRPPPLPPPRSRPGTSSLLLQSPPHPHPSPNNLPEPG
jgi:hypothetical protein